MAEKKDIYDFKEDIIIETNDVSKELISIAKEYNIKISQLDFDIQNVKTLEIDHEQNGSWVELEGGLLKRLEEKNHFSQNTLEIKQYFTIKIFIKDDYDDAFRDSVTHLTANDDFTIVYFMIEKGSELHYQETLKRDMINLINKKKVLNNVFINIREKGFRHLIDEFIEREEPVLEKNFIIKVSQGVPIQPQIDDKLEFIYKKDIENKSKSESLRVDHSKKGYMITVAQNELIIAYIKPQEGIDGKDCRGKVLQAKPPKTENIPAFRVSNNIKIVETKERVEYISLKDGNIIFKEDLYDIESNVQTGALSFKGTGSIDAGTDKNIEINVTEGDSVKDAVGTGVKVTVSTLNVDGNIGEKAEITANDVKINGQTHQSSIIRANKVEIDIHKGKVYADEVTITRLEAGLVEAEIVNIKEAIGGVIRAREVHIHNLFSHIKIYSSKKIEIDNIIGSENLIVIDLEGYKDGINEIEETRVLLTEASQRVEYLQRLLKEELDEVLEIRRAFTIATKRLKKFEENEVEPPENLIDTLDEHKEFLEHYKEMKEEVKTKRDKVTIYEKKFEDLEGAIFDAELRVHDKWKGYDKIEFRLINPKKTLEKIELSGSTNASFKLEKIMYEDNQFEIVVETLDDIKDID